MTRTIFHLNHLITILHVIFSIVSDILEMTVFSGLPVHIMLLVHFISILLFFFLLIDVNKICSIQFNFFYYYSGDGYLQEIYVLKFMCLFFLCSVPWFRKLPL